MEVLKNVLVLLAVLAFGTGLGHILFPPVEPQVVRQVVCPEPAPAAVPPEVESLPEN